MFLPQNYEIMWKSCSHYIRIWRNSCENKSIYILSLFRLCVWPPFFSTPSHDRNSRPVSLEPVWPEKCPSKNNFPKNWPMAKLPMEKNKPLMLFYEKNLAQFVFMFETQSFSESEVPNAGVTFFNGLSREFIYWSHQKFLIGGSREFNGIVTKTWRIFHVNSWSWEHIKIART